MKLLLVSIIIVNYNGKEVLKKLLDSLHLSTFKNYETLVLDNASTDGSQALIKKNYKKVKLVANKENLGYSGINSAIKYCKGKYILFLNNDMEIDKNCISQLVKTIKSNKNIAMVAPKLVNFYNKKLKSGGTWVSRAFYNGHIKSNGIISSKEIPYLGVGLIRKDFVDMFGYLFDPDYFIYGEDVDLGLRIRLVGKKVLFEPKSIMYHMHSVTSMKSLKSRSTFLMERNLLMTFFKIFSLRNMVLLLPYVLAMRIFAMVNDILKLNFSKFLSRLEAISWTILNFGKIMEKRDEVQKYRKADDKYILKAFTEKYLFRKKFIV